MGWVSYWTKCHEDTYRLFDIIWLCDTEVVHNSCCHGMTDVANLIGSCLCFHIVNHSYSVIFCHLRETEIPVFILVFLWIKSGMLISVLIASKITEPHIVALACCNESRCILQSVDHPRN